MDVSKDPKVNVTRQCVERALHNDLGPNAVLRSFQVEDFVDPGEGYIGQVTSVICMYHLNGQEHTVTHVAKLRASFPMLGFQEFATELCDKEAYFLTQVSPELDKSLKGVDVAPLNVPVCVLNYLDGMKSVFLMKDAREKKFKKQIGQNVFDKDHASLTLREVAKFHAAGFILKQEKRLLDRFPKLEEKWYAKDSLSRKDMNIIFSDTLKDLIELLSGDENYVDVIEYTKEIMEDPLQIIAESMKNGTEAFETICHGDVRDGNLLFRYSDDGVLEDVILLDLQLARVTSCASDLVFFFFSTTDEELREAHFESLLTEYFQALSAILHKASLKVPFTFEDLKKEYSRCKGFGFIFAQILLVMYLKLYNEEPVDYTRKTGKEEEAQVNKERTKTVKLMKSHPMFKSRYLAMVEDCRQGGVFDRSHQ